MLVTGRELPALYVTIQCVLDAPLGVMEARQEPISAEITPLFFGAVLKVAGLSVFEIA